MKKQITSIFAFLSLILSLVTLPSTDSFAQEGLVVNDPIAPMTDLNLPFGALAIGKTSLTHLVTIKNTSSGSFSVPPLQLSGSGANSFVLDVNSGSSPCGLDIVLAAGESCSLSLSFVPDEVGEQTAFLEVSSKDAQIAFHNQKTGGISLYDLNTRLTTHVTNPGLGSGIIDDFPSWSPGRGQIVFHRQDDNEGFSALYRIDIDGNNEIFVIGKAEQPDWSPNGRKIVFRETKFGGIKVLDLSFNFLSDSFGGNAASGEASSPRWSPDGEDIVYRKNPGGIGGAPNIFRSTAEGLGRSFLISNGRSPDISRDGQYIAFARGLEPSGISIVASDGTGTVTSLTPESLGVKDQRPSWSPDGTQIVFERVIEGVDASELHIIEVANPATSQRLLLEGQTADWSPTPFLKLVVSGEALPSTQNSPPSAPQLVAPLDQITGLETSVTFEWLGVSDPDGDNVTYSVLVCTAEASPICINESLTKATQAAAAPLSLATTGVLLFGVLLVPGLRKKSFRAGAMLLLIFSVSVMIACGSSGGSNSGGPVTPPTPEVVPETGNGGGTGPGGSLPGSGISLTISGLSPNTNYNWAVTATDIRDDVTEQKSTASIVWRFKTKA